MAFTCRERHAMCNRYTKVHPWGNILYKHGITPQQLGQGGCKAGFQNTYMYSHEYAYRRSRPVPHLGSILGRGPRQQDTPTLAMPLYKDIVAKTITTLPAIGGYLAAVVQRCSLHQIDADKTRDQSCDTQGHRHPCRKGTHHDEMHGITVMDSRGLFISFLLFLPPAHPLNFIISP